MRETDVLVVGAGSTGLDAALAAQEAGARTLVCEKRDDPAPEIPPGLRVLNAAMVTDLILTPDGDVAGALVLDGDTRELKPVRAKAVVLATGDADALWPEPADTHLTGDGYAIAHRAGADLDPFHVHEVDGRVAIHGGVACDPDGGTKVGGLLVAGSVAAAKVDGRTAGAQAAAERVGEAGAFGPYSVNPAIDPPLPKGFTAAKLDRLRKVLANHLGAGAEGGLADAEHELLQLKGEADEFARARVDIDLYELRNACEVALLLVRAAEAERRPA